MLNFDRIENKFKQDEQPDNNSKKPTPPVKKKNKSSFTLLFLCFAILIVSGIVYHFWPTIKSVCATTTSAVLNNDVSLTGISYSENDTNPIAIVNGEIVHEDDMIGDVRILKIHKDKVEFERDGQTWSQSMPSAETGTVSGLPVLLELGSHKCPPCRQMMPILDELREEYSGKFQVRYIDVWKDRAAGEKYGVRAIPTQIFFDSKGREIFRHVGFYPKKDILATWKKIGIKL